MNYGEKYDNASGSFTMKMMTVFAFHCEHDDDSLMLAENGSMVGSKIME
jgi:hypothetical protein